jgi:hypothetical protein
MKALVASCLALSLCGPAFADELPKHNCHQPVVPNSQASDLVVKQFNKHRAKYQECIDKFVEEQRAFQKSTADTVKGNQAFDAAEVAQKEYNDFVDEVNKRNPQDDDDQSANIQKQQSSSGSMK